MRKTRGIDPLHYSTAGVPVEERHAAWSERGWPSVAAAFDSVPLEEFSTSSDLVRLGELMVSYAEGTARLLERGRDRIAEGTLDVLGVGILIEGQIEGRAGDREVHAGPSEILLLDALQPASLSITANRSIQLSVPRVIAVEAGLDVVQLHGAVIGAAAAGMLVSHLARLREALPQLSEDEGPRAARTLLDLLVLAVNASERDPTLPSDGRSGLADRARQVIDANLGSPTLSIAGLCRRLGISRSTLHRLFEDDGGVQSFIRNSRLAAARLALLDPANGERIGELAERLGFSDAAHLSRLFRARYGETPSACRAGTQPLAAD